MRSFANCTVLCCKMEATSLKFKYHVQLRVEPSSFCTFNLRKALRLSAWFLLTNSAAPVLHLLHGFAPINHYSGLVGLAA